MEHLGRDRRCSGELGRWVYRPAFDPGLLGVPTGHDFARMIGPFHPREVRRARGLVVRAPARADHSQRRCFRRCRWAVLRKEAAGRSSRSTKSGSAAVARVMLEAGRATRRAGLSQRGVLASTPRVGSRQYGGDGRPSGGRASPRRRMAEMEEPLPVVKDSDRDTDRQIGEFQTIWTATPSAANAPDQWVCCTCSTRRLRLGERG